MSQLIVPIDNKARTARYTVGSANADYIVTGTSNHHLKIQAAIDAAHTTWLLGGNVSEVFLRNFVYDCRQIKMKSGVYLRGESKWGVVLSLPSNYSATAIINENYDLNDDTTGTLAAPVNVMDRQIGVFNLTIRHEGNTKTSGGGILYQGIKDFIVEDVDVVGSPRFNMLVTGRYGEQITGTVNVTNGSDNMSGTGTLFLTELKRGSIVRIRRDGAGESDRFVRVERILSDTLIKLDGTYGQETSTGRSAYILEANSGMFVNRCRWTGNYQNDEAYDNSGYGFCDYGIIKDSYSYNAQGYGFGPDHSQGIQIVNCYAFNNGNGGLGLETCAYAQVIGGNYNYNSIGIRMLSGTYGSVVTGAFTMYNTNGILVERNSSVFPTAKDNKFNGHTSKFNDQHGARVAGANGTQFNGGDYANNGISGIVLITGTSNAPIGTQLNGVHCYDDRPTKTQDYGIYIINGVDTKINLVTALDSENEIQGINDAGTNTQYAVRGTVYSTDVEVTDATKGVILKSPNGTRWRVTVNDAGSLTTTSL